MTAEAPGRSRPDGGTGAAQVAVPAPRRSADAPPLPALVGGRYRLTRLLRHGHVSFTAEAEDLRERRPVVVKAARTALLGRGTRLRVAHEVDVLRRLDHPGLAPLLDSGASDGLLYLVLPLVPGASLAHRLGAAGPLTADETLTVARELLTTLAVVHDAGILHRDLKPANVLVDGVPVRTVTLVDFGLAHSVRLEAEVRDQPVGTARYASPEQAGSMHRPVDERSDLYSLGVLLFEASTGRPPFAGSTVGEVLRQHVTAPVPDPRAGGARMPTLLAQLVMRLLRKEPRDRYQTAAGALADVERLIARRADGDDDPSFTLGAEDARRVFSEPAFVGRGEESAALLELTLQAVRGSSPGVVRIEAPSGGGKTRLLDELLAQLPDPAPLVLRGQGVDEAARPPFGLLDGAAAELVAAARADQRLAQELCRRLAPHRCVLTAVLPVLGELLGSAEGSEALGPEEHGEARALAALGQLLDAVGSSGPAAVVVLDDCQWADDATVRLLRRWQRDRDPAARVVVLAAYRDEEVAADHQLRQLGERPVRLRPFGAGDVAALVESMAGPVPEAALQVVHRLSAGSPFMATAVLRGLVESGALFHDGRGWRTDDVLLGDARSSREAAAFLVHRLERLDAVDLRLLTAGAVLGKSFDLDVTAGLVGRDPVEVLGRLRDLRRHQLVWVDDDVLRASFVHDKLREAVLARLDVDQRRRLHARAAELLARREAAPYELAYHFHAAGEPQAALPFALAAATEARERHALDVAEQQYRIALAGVDDGHAEAQTRRLVHVGLGDVLMLRGRYDEAARCYADALHGVRDRRVRAELEQRLGELAFKRGAVPESVTYLEQALRSLGRFVPPNKAVALACVLWEALVQAGHCLLPRRLGRRPLGRAADDIAAARIHSRLAYSYWFSKGAIWCGWAHLREMNKLERYPPTAELAQAYSEHAPVASTLPWFSRGIAYARRSLAIRTELGDIWGQGQSLHFYGVVLYSGSRFEEAIVRLTEAIRLLERTGDQWEINTARWHIGFCHYRLGREADAVEALARCYANATEIGDVQATAIALSGWSKASGGQVEAAAVESALERCRGDVHSTGELAAGEAVRLLAAGEPAQAAALLQATARQVSAVGIRNEYVAALLPWLLTALRRQAEAVPAYDLAQRRALLRRAWWVGVRARLIALAFRNNYPHVLREQALLAQLAGRRDRARRRLAKAQRVAHALGMQGELAELRQAAVTIRTGVAGALAAVTPVEAREPTLSLVDRFDALLRVGRSLATALTAEDVHVAVRSGAAELLRSESCHVLLVDGADLHSVGSAADTDPALLPSEPLVRRAVADRCVAVYARDADEELTDSIALAHARSALAAPVFVRGRPVAVWHVAHRQVSGLFGPEEVRLAEFVSTLAGAALENAEGFAEVQALSQGLERRVQDRTTELSVANDALRRALDELERANGELRRLDELKSDFVAMVSHELRSPLTSILGYCQTMLRHWDRVDDERKQSFVAIIDRQSQHLSRLVNDLLEMSRIEAGRLDTALAPVALRPLLEELAHDYQVRLDDLQLAGAVDSVVQADRDHLRRVLVNLLDNALKYGASPVSVVVSPRGDLVELAVRDGGPGVPEEFRPRLFEKFAQASAGSTRSATGTGLGLSIVRGLVQAMDGTVRYEPPRGATAGGFVVVLPRS